jgi:hypothetical protein
VKSEEWRVKSERIEALGVLSSLGQRSVHIASIARWGVTTVKVSMSDHGSERKCSAW